MTPGSDENTTVSFPEPSDLGIVGNHPAIARLRALIVKVAATDSTVLITGESGTGKELVARAIHALSNRRSKPFVAVNCAAIPHEMLESEMFGHQRGAFTGAVTGRQGLFLSAEGGVLFLDEIGEMPLALQAKLLRVLEERMVRPLGSDRAQPVDVRLIAASNRNLDREVAARRFRPDLYYRLRVVPISLPPLRDRRSDIPVLVEHFLARLQERFGGRRFRVTPEAMVHLWNYDWPGNVRELQNTLEGLLVMAESDTIDVGQLPPALLENRCDAGPPRIDVTLDDEGLNLTALVRSLEGRLINEALRRTGGNATAAARLLGLKRTTFSAKLRRCGVVYRSQEREATDYSQ